MRLAILGGALGFAALEHNPLVRMVAILGLSPSPLERLFGIRGAFSGMTEAAHRLARGDFAEAFAANALVYPLAIAALIYLWRWRMPRIRTRRDELAVFALAIVASLLNNWLPRLFA